MNTTHPQWQLGQPPEISPDLLQIAGHPLAARLLAQRGMTSAEAAAAFLYPERYSPAPPEALPDLLEATVIIERAIQQRQHILIWGDFDVDGQTATSLLLSALHPLGAHVTYYIPDRISESHGIRVDSLAEVINQTVPDILLTCDTGVSEHEAVSYANQQGVTVVVTDHHDLPPTLPDAAAVVNPKQLPPGHPLANLPGVGTAYKLVEALYARSGLQDKLVQFLDLVALGIVADVVTQVGDVRYLLQCGLDVLRTTRRPGLVALCEAIGLNPAHINTEAIGFQLAPRLNAAGRLAHAKQCVELLTTQDMTQARVIAANLDGLNKKRQVMQRQILAAAQEMIASQPELLDYSALVLSHPEWHPGLLGIVAGHLAEQYQRPCVLLVAPGNETVARGSARSARGYDIGQAVRAQADLLLDYGGHPGAAGLSLPAANIALFRRKLSRSLQEQQPAAQADVLIIDAALSLTEVDMNTLGAVEHLAPFGEGNPTPVFMSCDLQLVREGYIGRDRQHRKLTVQSADGVRQEILWWNSADEKLPTGSFDLAFTVGKSVYKGEVSLALTLQAYRLRTPEAVAVLFEQVTEDWRATSEAPEALIERFCVLEANGLVWAEGIHLPDLLTRVPSERCAPRWNLTRSEALLVYSAPPSAHLLRAVLDIVQPQRVYLLGILPPEVTVQHFLDRLIGLAKHTINQKQGRVEMEKLAAAAGQTQSVVLSGLRYLAASGKLRLEEHETGIVLAAPARNIAADAQVVQEIGEVLRALFAETTAYRTFFRKVQPDTLLS